MTDQEDSHTNQILAESSDDCNDEASPIFIKKLPKMKEIEKGDSIDFKVLFIGEPIPDIKWEFDSDAIQGDIT